MQYCCAEFEKYVKNAEQDGFSIHQSLWMVPYTVKMVLLRAKIAGETQSVKIDYCPWCGASLTAKKEQ